MKIHGKKRQEVEIKGLKICFVIGTLGQGGAERQLFYILQNLLDAGADVSLISFTRGEYWEKPLMNIGVKVYYIDSKSKSGKLLALLKLVKKISPRILQSMHFYVNVYIAVIGKLTGIITIGAVRSNLIEEMKPHGKVLANLGLKGPDYIVTNSMDAYANAMKIGYDKDRMFYLPNAVDTDRFRFKDYNHTNENTSILTIGRLGPEKRYDKLIRISGLLKDENVITTIIGDGKLKNELEEQVKYLNFNEGSFVFMKGQPDTETYYTRADIFVLTSDFEGTPNVVLEAMSCGLPVVASSVGNLPNIIRQGITGYLVNRKDEEGFLKEIKMLVMDKSLRKKIGTKAREFIVKEFSIPALSPRLVTIYTQITTNEKLKRK